MSRIFGPIDQVAYVVPDLESAAKYWAEVLGIGPWFVISRVRPDDFRFDGAPSPVEMSLAIAYSGRTQIELIEQHNDAPSMYKEAIDAGRFGQHHLGFFRRDYEARLESALSAGYRIGQQGSLGGSIRFAYLRTDREPGAIVELVELTDPIEASFVALHQQALAWDGSDPIRPLGPGGGR